MYDLNNTRGDILTYTLNKCIQSTPIIISMSYDFIIIFSVTKPPMLRRWSINSLNA